jgi:hypothetical protein
MNKKTILTSFILSFTSLAAASHGGSGGIFALLGQLPLPTENWRQIAFSAATFGLIWFTVYMIVKKLVDRFGLEDLFNMSGSSSVTSSDDSRNLGAVLSLLIVLSMMGAAHNFMNIILSIQQLLLLALGFGIVALAIAVVGGGGAGILAVGGASGKALGWGGGKAKEGAKAAKLDDAWKEGKKHASNFKNKVQGTMGSNKYVDEAGNKYASAANSLGFNVCSNCYKLNGQGANKCSDCKNSL